MNFEYSRATIGQGRKAQQRQQETPVTFGKQSGADDVQQVSNLDRPKERMAGDYGERIMDYMNDPMEKQRTDNWMDAFGLSNEGFQFNQAKMMMEQGGPPQEEEMG